MWAVVAVHPDDRERRYLFPHRAGAERAYDLLSHAPWVPEPKCPCCQMQTVTIDGQELIRYAIEELALAEV